MKKTEKAKSTSNVLAQNKKAYHDYEILEKYEAGVVLHGDEVKSIRDGQANLKGSFVDVWKEEAFLNEVHISRFKFSSNKDYNPTRKRKLILHKKEIAKIEIAITQKGVTAVPLQLHLKGGLIKAVIGICRGKKLYDKRADMKKRDQEREIKIQLKKYSTR